MKNMSEVFSNGKKKMGYRKLTVKISWNIINLKC